MIMKETSRIGGLFMNLYSGHPWLDITLEDTLKTVSWEQAATKVDPQLNSIWEIVNHMISWRRNVLQRVNGEVIKTPENNYFQTVPELTEQAWKQTLAALKDSQAAWIAFLERADDGILEHLYQVNRMSYYEQIHGIIQHDAIILARSFCLLKCIERCSTHDYSYC
jgi:uncharacterized damage-inducible protein DinB